MRIKSKWILDEESVKHKRTWMVFGTSEYVWDDRTDDVYKDLGKLANTIVEYEPVSVIMKREDKAKADKMLDERIEYHYSNINDFWIRDTGAIFVRSSDHKKRAAISFNFNANKMSKWTGERFLRSELTMEGGSIEVDGIGTGIMTESSVLINNRNKYWKKSDVLAEVKYYLGVHKIIWLKGVKDKDITDGHVDFYARFVRPGHVVVHLEMDNESFDYKITRNNLKVLQSATDVNGDPLKITIIRGPKYLKTSYPLNDFALSYVNYYVVNGGVIMPKFGDVDADRAAKKIMEDLYIDRDIIQLSLNAIASGGGGIHCSTQQQPE
ncbi:hypothetical protein SNEBB_001342 [Seison nebaliae]|nr:hypothetical protein SNEBB_001342 [Seison nebaliae]